MALELNEKMVGELVRRVLREMLAEGCARPLEEGRQAPGQGRSGKLSPSDYPLAEKRPEMLRTPTGKGLHEVTLDNLLSGKVGYEDLRITPEALEWQAQIAESAGYPQVAANLRRAAELVKVPDERLLQIYNALRPHRSTKEELLAIADELEGRYGARTCAAFVREAAEVYQRRKLLKGDIPAL